MKHFILPILMSFLVSTGAWAQRFVVTGLAQDIKTKNPIEFASVSLLRSDSTAIAAGTTDEKGFFKINGKTPGNFILRISYIGFETIYRPLNLSADKDSLNLGTLFMKGNDNLLGTATVSTAASRIEQKGDTTMFNASAYRVPEGSTLEALVKQLPGVEVSDEGTIKWNGKKVNEFLINGKDFFKGDTETAMKNLPVDLVSKVKAYQKKSDYTEQTGIDDGEESTVLDINTKRQLNNTWLTTVDVAYGNHDRYSANVFSSRFSDHSQVSVFGNLNNTNNKNYGGGYGRRGGGGLVASKNAGLDFTWENDKEKFDKNKLEIGGSLKFDHMDSDKLSSSNSETFLTAGRSSSFNNSFKTESQKRTNFTSDFRFRWNPDSMTRIIFRPAYSYSESHNHSANRSATFNADPFDIDGMINPLDSIFAQNVIEANPELYAIMVNTNRRLSMGDTKNHDVNGRLNITRKLNTNGRNLSLNLRGGYSKSESNNFSISHISYNPNANLAPKFLNQYSTSPSEKYNYSVRLGYAEPLTKNWFLETRYQYSFKYTDSDRSRFNLDSLSYEPYASLFPEYNSFGDPDNHPLLGTLPTKAEVLDYVRDLNNSQYATYKYYDHNASLGIRYNDEKIRFNANVDFNPEKTKMAYNRPGQHIDTLITRDVFKVAPQIRFRYKFSNTTNLDITYRGNSSQPSMTNLLAVVDDSNPLNISMGNPGLKPSWENRFNLDFNDYNIEKQLGMATNISFNQTSNSISNRMAYDETTGVRYTRPENINGNWNGRAMFMVNSAMGKKKLFTLNSFTYLSYNNAVGYVSRINSNRPTPGTKNLFAIPTEPMSTVNHDYDFYNAIFASASAEKNKTRTVGVSQSMRAAYRNSWFDIGALGRVRYEHARATIQENANMDTWNFSYGANANINLDFGLSLSTDIRMSSRRGYSDASMNTNELLWNAQIAYSFLPQRAATISFQIFDILQEKSNISRQLTATQRVDTWNNAIDSFFMVHFVYKLNLFNGKKNTQKPEQGNGYYDRMKYGGYKGGGKFPHKGGGYGPSRHGNYHR